MNYEKIKKDFDKMSEQEQWDFLLKNKEIISIMLDNDNTTDTFNSEDKSEDCTLLVFKADIGNRWGVDYLLNSIGVTFQHC